MIDGISQHYDAISAQNIQRRRSRQARVVSDSFAIHLRKRSLRTAPSPIGASVADTLFYANLPDKIKKREFTREEQVLLAGQLRASVILDAADEAIYKIGRRRASTTTPDITIDTPTTVSSFRHSMETLQSSTGAQSRRRDALGLEMTPAAAKRVSGVPESFYNSFRWAEEEDDLDLRLFLDDYHTNLREALPAPSTERRPSFRRHLSISKMPFSRPSAAPTLARTASSAAIGGSQRPATKDDVSSLASPRLSGTTAFPTLPPSTSHSTSPVAVPHVRRKSRALSLITSKHAANDSISTIDPAAAHYQDPEARLKLRVYLASPQKFDEAIEFGFPSTEVLSCGASPPISSPTAAGVTLPMPVSTKQRRRGGARQSTPDGPDNLRTFLADDDDEDDNDNDQASMPDPESPKTPNLIEVASSHGQQGGGVSGHRVSESYAQVPASSREMTLRMTLTRLDLRAGEDQIYGWQQQQQHGYGQSHGAGHGHQSQLSWSGRKSSSTQSPPLLREDSPAMYIGPAGASGTTGSRPKESIENVFAGIDHWEADAQEKGVMKRLWNRVRRS